MLEVAFSALYLAGLGLWLLFALRLLHGIAFGTCSTAIGTIVTALVPDNRKGEGVGYYMPVSYTHLDVYKRQEQHDGGDLLRRTLLPSVGQTLRDHNTSLVRIIIRCEPLCDLAVKRQNEPAGKQPARLGTNTIGETLAYAVLAAATAVST